MAITLLYYFTTMYTIMSLSTWMAVREQSNEGDRNIRKKRYLCRLNLYLIQEYVPKKGWTEGSRRRDAGLNITELTDPYTAASC